MTTNTETTNGPSVGRQIGALLREARENTGMSVPEVSRALRIRQIYLEAIEADDYTALPGKTYVLGFLRSYAELLGLDAEDVAQRYRRQTEYSSLLQSPLNFPMRDIESRMPRGAVILLSLVLAGGAIYGGARYFGADDAHRVDRVAPVPDRLIASEQPTLQPSPAYVPRQDPASAYAAQMPQGNESNEHSKSAPMIAAAPPPVMPPPPVTPVPEVDSSIGAETPIASSNPAPTAAAPSAAIVAAPVAAPPPPAVTKPAPQAATPPAAASKPTSTTASKPADKPSTSSATPPASNQTASLPPKTEEPAPAARDIVVVARVDSWIEVRDLNNRPLVSLLLRVGDSYRVPSGANYRLVTGDLRGLEVRVDGIAVPQKNVDDGHLHRTMSLDTDRLRTGNGLVE